jgi:hypothetical protein
VKDWTGPSPWRHVVRVIPGMAARG